jgi:hypothetical protein
MSESKQSPRKVLAAQRSRAAIKLRTGGASYDHIAEALQVSKTGAYRMVQRAFRRLNEKLMIDTEALRRETVEQLEELLAVHLPLALDGDVKSGNLAIRALAERARITGVIKNQAVVPAANPYENWEPDALREEGRRLGLLIDSPPTTAPAAIPPAPSSNGTGSNGHAPDWPPSQPALPPRRIL